MRHALGGGGGGVKQWGGESSDGGRVGRAGWTRGGGSNRQSPGELGQTGAVLGRGD